MSIEVSFLLRQALLGSVERGFVLRQALRGEIELSLVLRQALTEDLEVTFNLRQALLDRDPVELGFDLVQAMPDPTPVIQTMPNLVLADGREIALLSLDIQCDEGGHCLGFSFGLAELADWRELAGRDATLSVAGQDFALVLEDPTLEASFGSRGLTIGGRSPACRLEQPYADPVTRSWTGALARSICREMTDLAGLLLVWQIDNWIVPSYEAEGLEPIEVIREIATEAAMVLSRPDGALVVRWRYPRSPWAWSTATPALTLNDWDHVLEVSETLSPKPGWNEVLVIDQEAEEQRDLRLLDWTGEASVHDVELQDDQRLVACFQHPWTADPVLRSSTPGVTITPLGVVEELRTEDVEFVLGRASLGYPALFVDAVTWPGEDLGAVALEDRADLVAAIEGQALATVVYTTRYFLWLVASAPGRVQLWTEVE